MLRETYYGQKFIFRSLLAESVMLCAIWHHLHNFKNVKNTDRGVKPKARNFTISNTPTWMFPRSFSCTNGTKSRRGPHIH